MLVMFRRPRIRLRIAIVLIASLLFQQVAVAAYACAKAAAPPPPPPGMEHCAQMGMAPAATQSPALCEKHCAPDLSLTTDATAPTVPPPLLPPSFSLVLDEPSAQAAHRIEAPISRSDPPPRLRFCSLLI
ncbi:MAG: hypothetical protein ACREO3_07785 [Arenimonas sp.]